MAVAGAIATIAMRPAAAAHRRKTLIRLAFSVMGTACRVAGVLSSTLAARRATRYPENQSPMRHARYAAIATWGSRTSRAVNREILSSR